MGMNDCVARDRSGSARGGRLRQALATAILLAGVLPLTALPATAAAPAQLARDPLAQVEPAESLEGNFLAAIIAGASRDTGAAALFYREALKADPRNAELIERAFVAFVADGAMNEAFRQAERLVQREPNHGMANLVLGVRAMRAKQYATARQFFNKGQRGRAADITATLLSAWTHAGTGEGGRAAEALDRLRRDTAFASLRDYHAGLIADVTGNSNEALRRMRAAYESERTTLRIADALGRLEAKRGNTDLARAIYQDFEKLAPRQPIIQDALATLDAGRPLAPFVTNAQQGAAEVLYSLGTIALRQDDPLVAMIYLRLALHLDPRHTVALVTLGDVLERNKQIDRALALYEQVPEDSPLRASTEIQIGLSLEQAGRGEEAEAWLRRIKDKRPGDIDAVTALGNIFHSRKEFAKAAEAFTRAIELAGTPDRSRWSLFYYRGIAHERTKQWPKAEADFKRALELIPEGLSRERALVLNYLGYSWVDQHMNLEEAFQMLRKAVELQPRDGYIIDSLGWAYYRLGRYEDAVRELERAIELRPADPVINDHLGDAYWRVGRRLEAKFQWAHARDLNPEPDELPKILRKLEVGLPDATPEADAADIKAAEPPKNGG